MQGAGIILERPRLVNEGASQ